jgi:hypothetical protein
VLFIGSFLATTKLVESHGCCLPQVWTERGVLVASFMQEGLVRPPRNWEPQVAPAESLEAAAARTLDVLQQGAATAAATDDGAAATRAKL